MTELRAGEVTVSVAGWSRKPPSARSRPLSAQIPDRMSTATSGQPLSCAMARAPQTPGPDRGRGRCRTARPPPPRRAGQIIPIQTVQGATVRPPIPRRPGVIGRRPGQRKDPHRAPASASARPPHSRRRHCSPARRARWPAARPPSRVRSPAPRPAPPAPSGAAPVTAPDEIAAVSMARICAEVRSSAMVDPKSFHSAQSNATLHNFCAALGIPVARFGKPTLANCDPPVKVVTDQRCGRSGGVGP